MKVIYSVGAKFAGGGIGTTAYHAVSGLHRHQMLAQLLCGSYRSTEIPASKIKALGLPNRAVRKLATYDKTGWIWYWQSVLYDAWSAGHLESGDWFHVWGNYGLKSLAKAKEMGMMTSIERASSHPFYQANLLKEEYARWGLTFSIPEANLKRSLAELHAADYVFIPSDFVRKTFLAEGFPERRLVQIPFGTDIKRFSPTSDTASHPFRVLYLSQLSIQKGIIYLLKAWKQLKWSDAELWLVGKIDLDIKSIVERYLNLPGIRYFGYVSDPSAIYQQSDVFVFPTLQDGAGLVMHEAMACGLPVVATINAGAVDVLIQSGIEGFITPIRNEHALAECLERLRTNLKLRKEMGQRARIRAEMFSWERYGDELANRLIELN